MFGTIGDLYEEPGNSSNGGGWWDSITDWLNPKTITAIGTSVAAGIKASNTPSYGYGYGTTGQYGGYPSYAAYAAATGQPGISGSLSVSTLLLAGIGIVAMAYAFSKGKS